jgi:lysophospholipase
MSSFLPWFSLPNTMESKYLTHDAARVRAYDEDPLVFHAVTARWFQIMMQITPKAMSAAAQIQVPLFLQLSEDDHVVDFETNKQWYTHLTGIESAIKPYKGFYHEIYNELGRQEPLTDMLDWFKRHSH